MYDELGEDGKRAHTVTAIAKAREPSAGRTFCRPGVADIPTDRGRSSGS